MPSDQSLPDHLAHFHAMPSEEFRTRLTHYHAQCRHHGLHEAADALGSVLEFLAPMWPVVGLTVGGFVGMLLGGGLGFIAGGVGGEILGEESGVKMAKAADALHLYAMTTGDHEATGHAQLLAHIATQKASSRGG